MSSTTNQSRLLSILPIPIALNKNNDCQLQMSIVDTISQKKQSYKIKC